MQDPPHPDLFRELVERSVFVYMVVDAETRVSYVSPSCRDLFGYEPEDLLGTLALDLAQEEDRPVAVSTLVDLMTQPGQGVPIVVGVKHRDGSTVYVEVGAYTAFDNPAVGGIMVRLRPYDDQRMLHEFLEALAKSVPIEQTLLPLVRSIKAQHLTSEVSIVYDWDGERFNSAVHTGLPPSLSGAADLETTTWAPWNEAQRTGQPSVAGDLSEIDPVLRPIAADAGLCTCWAYPVPVPPDNALLACLVVWRGIAGPPMLGHQNALDQSVHLAALAFERRHTEELLRHAALHDTLTGIPNRSHFFQALDTVLQSDAVERSAVLFLDLDGFKEINDTHGHGVGDAVLTVVARRLQASIRPGDLVARVGGDEFAVLCSGLGLDEDAMHLAGRLIEAVGRPIHIDGITATVGVSIGLAFHDSVSTERPRLIDAADRALLEAKQAGKNRWMVAPTA